MNAAELLVALKLDPAAFKNGCDQAKNALNKLQQGAQNAAQQGSGALTSMANKSQEVARQVQGVGSRLTQMGQQWAGNLVGIVKSVAAPLLGLMSVSAVVGAYTSNVAERASRSYAMWGVQLEEMRRKRELLMRVTKEDIRLYKDRQLAMIKLEYAAKGVADTFMRSLTPHMRKGVDVLNKIGDWVRANENNIVRFLKVVVGVITVAMIPAMIKLAAVMLANPITWIIAAFIALALVIDDLVVYIQGGDSALADFWAQWGTGPELAAKLGKAWEKLKELGARLWAAMKKGVELFIHYFGSAFRSIGEIISAVIDTVLAIIEGDWSGAWEACKRIFLGAFNFVSNILSGWGELFSDLYNAIVPYFEKIKAAIPAALEAAGNAVRRVVDAIKDAIGSAFQAAADMVRGVWGGIFNWFKEKFSWIFEMWDKVSGFAGKLFDGAKDMVGGVVDFFTGGSKDDKGKSPTAQTTAPAAAVIPSGAQMQRAAVPPKVEQTTTNTTTTTTNISAINITTPNGDPNTIAQGVGGALKNQMGGVAAANSGVNQG